MPEFCETCRFFKPPELHIGGFYTDHELAASGMGECLMAAGTENGPVVDGTLAWASDYADYKAKLFVRPSFGCVQHKPKVPACQSTALKSR